MDKDNKYYGIIENLVKNHRKFPGLEAIADDIIDDVYAHSKSIIETINDDKVIDAYLNKVVSTSIITVPKRLNFHSEVKHTSISADYETVKTVVHANEIDTLEEELQKDEAVQAVSDTEDVLEQKDLQEELIAEESILDDIAENNFTNDNDEQNIAQLDTDYEIETENETIETDVDKADSNLVDKMINSITEDTLKENGLSDEISNNVSNSTEEFEEDAAELINDVNEAVEEDIEEDGDDVLSEEVDFNDLLEETSSEDILTEEPVHYSDVSSIENLNDLQVEEFGDAEESQTFDLVDDDIEESNDDSIIADTMNDNDEQIEEYENIFTDDEDNELEPGLQEDTIENNSYDEKLDILELSEPEFKEETISLTEETDSEELLTEDEIFDNTNDESTYINDADLQEIDSDESLNLNEDENEILLESDFDEVLNSDEDSSDLEISEEEQKEEHEIKHTPIDYSAFDYSPREKAEYSDSEEVVAKLLDIDNQEPELNILKIFDLKYKQNLTIEEIMSELNLEKQDVIAALDKMVELI